MPYITDAAREYAKKRIKKTKVKDNDESLYDYIDELLEETKTVYDKPSIVTFVVNGATGKQIDKDSLKHLFELMYVDDDVNEFTRVMKMLTELDIGKIEREYGIEFNKNEKDTFIKKGIQSVFNTLNGIYGDINNVYRKKKDELEKLKALPRAEKDKIMFDFLNKVGLTEAEIKKYKAVARTLTLNDIVAHDLWHIFGTTDMPGESPAGMLLEHAYKNDFDKLSKDDIQYLNEYLSTVDDPLSVLYEELDYNDGPYDIDVQFVDQSTLSKLKQLVKKGYETIRSMKS